MRLALLSVVLMATAVLGASDRRIGTLVVPMDKASEPMALKLEGFVNDTLKEFPAYQVKTTDEMFGVTPDDEAAAALKRAEAGHAEAKALFDARNGEEAAKKLRATAKEFAKAVAVMKACGNYCDTVAMLGATLLGRGDTEEAKFVILDLISLGNPELDRKRFSQEFLSLKAQVGASRNAQLRGALNVKSRPAGGRVFLNGEFQGFTPTTLQTLPNGKTMVRVDRPGFKQAGAVVDVGPEEQDLALDLTATANFKSYESQLDKLATEVIKDKGGATMAALAKQLSLDRAIIAVLRDNDGENELSLGYYELQSGRRLGFKRATFHGDEYGQLKGEVGRLVTQLLNNAESGGDDRVTRSTDPLDGKSGSEDWNAEDKGGRTNSKEKKKKKKGDPLEGVQGTEDW